MMPGRAVAADTRRRGTVFNPFCWARRWGGRGWLAAWLLLPSMGCTGDFSWRLRDLFNKPADPGAGAMDSFVLRGGGLERERALIDPGLQSELDAAYRSHKDKEYA